METPYADCRSAERWNRIVVSDPPPASLSMPQPVAVAGVRAHHQDVERLLGPLDRDLLRPVVELVARRRRR